MNAASTASAALAVPGYGTLLMWFIKHPDLVVVISNGAVAIQAAKTIDGRWQAVKPVGDAVCPALDELFPQPGTSSTLALGLPANMTEEELEAQVLHKLNGMHGGLAVLEPTAEGNPRRWDGHLLKGAAKFFLSDILPVLGPMLLKGALGG